jgi:hypothetical protein
MPKRGSGKATLVAAAADAAGSAPSSDRDADGAEQEGAVST